MGIGYLTVCIMYLILHNGTGTRVRAHDEARLEIGWVQCMRHASRQGAPRESHRGPPRSRRRPLASCTCGLPIRSIAQKFASCIPMCEGEGTHGTPQLIQRSKLSTIFMC